MRIALQAINGQYVVAEGGGGHQVNANRDAIGPWETFTLVRLDAKGVLRYGEAVLIRDVEERFYLRAGGSAGGSNAALTAGELDAADGGSIIFRLVKPSNPDDTDTVIPRPTAPLALRTIDQKYVVAEGGGGYHVRADRTAVGPWETFTAHFLDPR
jgi:hypothetical protein